jgi:hypothetical protein
MHPGEWCRHKPKDVLELEYEKRQNKCLLKQEAAHEVALMSLKKYNPLRI